MAETPLKITIGEDQVEGMLADNPAARDLISQLPLTLTFSDYGGQEIVATAPEGLTMEGMPSGESAPAGTIGYYAPQQAIVLYYTDVPRFPGIVRLGSFGGEVSLLSGRRKPRPVTIDVLSAP
ncbi:cyclophilin-like fold protein [Flaviflexus sp.]|uniref:cyclophilin-like fold protein n=1 Tax=Flaviflexus sp. TaxID=1969482 RepID=UPI003F9115DA